MYPLAITHCTTGTKESQQLLQVHRSSSVVTPEHEGEDFFLPHLCRELHAGHSYVNSSLESKALGSTVFWLCRVVFMICQSSIYSVRTWLANAAAILHSRIDHTQPQVLSAILLRKRTVARNLEFSLSSVSFHLDR